MTTAPPPPQRIPDSEANRLGLRDVTASTIANIGPGIDFYFAFGVIAVTAGIAAPLTILSAGVAVFLLASVAAEFTRLEPSSGSFIAYVESGLGAKAARVVAILLALGFTVALTGVFTMAGGMISLTLSRYLSWEPSWLPITLVMTAGAVAVTLRGARFSTKAVSVALVLQVLVMIAVCVVVLLDSRTHLSPSPFEWSRLNGGLRGLSAGFPLALYMLIGWENGPELADETRDAARTVPRALYLSIAATTALFVFFSFTTIAGFGYETSSIGRASVPFLQMSDRYLGDAAVLAWLAGIVSVLATLVAAANGQARMLFDAAREGLLPRSLGHAKPPDETPANAVLAMTAVGLAIAIVWWLGHEVGIAGGPPDPVNLYAESSTFGTILVLFVYVLTAVSLPLFMRKAHREAFSVARHVVVPVLGVLALVVPFVELFRPGQPAPYDVFPFLALGLLLASLVFALSQKTATATSERTRTTN